jgi:hypothetical protein
MVAIRHELVKGWSLAECELIASFSPVFVLASRSAQNAKGQPSIPCETDRRVHHVGQSGRTEVG